MGKPWEFEPKRGAELQAAATFRRRAAVSAFSRLAGRSLRKRGIDPSILTPSRGLEDNEPGTENERFERTVQRLTGMGMEPGEAVKQVRRFLDVTSRRTDAGMVRPKPTVQPGLDAVRQGVDQPPVPYRTRYDEKTEAAIQQFRTDLTAEGYEPWMIDTQLRGQIRLGALMEEIQANFPSRTPPGTTHKSLALDRLDKEMGDLLRKATPQGRKKGPIESFLADTLTGGLLKGLSIGLAELEKDPMLGGPFARTTEGQFPEFDPEGTTGFERGAEISRPVVQRGQEIVGEPFEQVGKAGIPVVSPVSEALTTAIRSQIVEDIGTEIINPAALVLVAPIVMQGTQGLRGVRLATQMTSNLLGTGLEPALARGTLRGLTILGRDGLAGLSKLSRAVRETPIIKRTVTALQSEAGGGPLSGGRQVDNIEKFVVEGSGKYAVTDAELKALESGQGTFRLYHGTPSDFAENILKEGFRQPPSGDEAIRRIAQWYDIPVDEFMRYGVLPHYGDETARISTSTAEVASRWADTGSFPRGEIFSNLNANARIHKEIVKRLKDRGVQLTQGSYDAMYNRLFKEAGDLGVGVSSNSRVAEILRLPDRFAAPTSGGTLLELEIDIAKLGKGDAKRIADTLRFQGPSQGAYFDVKIPPNAVKRIRPIATTSAKPRVPVDPIGGFPDRFAGRSRGLRGGPADGGHVRVELPGDAPTPRGPVHTPLERNILQANKPKKPAMTPALKPFERDQAGEALQRLSEAPDNPVPVRSRRDLPELSQYDDQLEAILRFRDDARDTLKFNRSAVKAGILSPSRIGEATAQLVRANEQLKASRSILKEAKIRATRDSVMKLVRSVGGSDEAAGIIGRAFDASVRLVPLEESLLTASSWRQHIAQGVALVKGRVFRGIGLLADQKFTLVDALHLQTADEANDLFRLMRKTLEKESDGLTFIGPSKYADLAEGEYRLHHIVQHPEWFTGKTPKLDGLLIDAQLMMRGRLEQARALGYPIEALDGAYLEQLWDIPRAALEQPILRARGKISAAKQRWFDDYFEGLSKGGKPLNLTVEELMQHSSSLLDEAIGDAWMRQEVLRRYGTRSAKVPALKGARRFGNPLYQGWSAPQDVTSAIDRLYSPVGTGSRFVGDVAATMKNTAFGLVDIAVGGVQFPLALAHGGREIAIGTLNRSLEALGLPYVHVALQDVNVVGRNVQYAEDGLHIGIGPSSVRLKSGTIVKYIPITGQYIDMPLSKTIDFSARMQFGQALTAIRRRMYEGNLISAKFVGQDITDPKVRQFWAEAANAGTGASRGAQTPGRRGLETFVLTSAPMTRANLAVYAQIAEGLTTGGRMQKLRTAMVLANLATYTYGMQYLINGVFGDGPMEWQPGKSDWATIRIKGETIPLMPQRTLARAIDKSITIITEGIEGEGWRPEDIALAWAQVIIGKSSPAVQAMLAPFGVGFEPDTGRFHVGGLSPRGRALGVPPTPPLVEQVIFQENDALSVVLAGVGFNPYPTSPNRLLQEEWKETTGQDFNPEVDWIVADSHPELSAEFSPLVAASNASSLKWGSLSALRRDRIEQFRGEKEVSSGLEKTAEEFIGGGDVGVVFIGEWLDHQAEMSAVISFNLFGDDRQAETPEGKALQAWGEVQPHDEKYRDPITRDVDRDAYRTDKEAAFAAIRKIYPELADSLEARIRAVSPNLVKVEPDIITALDALSGYREIDRWFGIDKAMENKVEDIHALVDAKRDELALQGFLDIGSGTVYTILADERPDISQNVWQAAWIVRPGADSNYRNPEADRYLIDHEPELRRFFPGLYRRGLLAVIGTGASGGTRRLSPALQARLGGK